MDFMDKMVGQYLVTALWSSGDDKGEPLDQKVGVSDISDESLKKADRDCKAFYDKAEIILGKNGDEITSLDPESIGHDFWLSRNGHGAGFFDAEYLDDEMQDALQELARSFGQVDPVIGDDGVVYFESSKSAANLAEAKSADPVLVALDSVVLDALKGGKGDVKKPSDFDLKQVLKGVLVELEHSSNGAKALEIVMDHLSEDLSYYDKLEKIEAPKTESIDKFGIPLLG